MRATINKLKSYIRITEIKKRSTALMFKDLQVGDIVEFKIEPRHWVTGRLHTQKDRFEELCKKSNFDDESHKLSLLQLDHVLDRFSYEDSSYDEILENGLTL